ncbi:hypothetical protein P8452_24273 [Trifolium repens]|nr:hypothetical protein P8452_24273 [Trifolium repens]
MPTRVVGQDLRANLGLTLVKVKVDGQDKSSSNRRICIILYLLITFFQQLGFSLAQTMTRVYIGNLDSRISERDLEDDFHVFGVIRSVWVARRPPGYAFIDFDDRRDALDAIRELDDDEESAQCLLSGLLIRSLSISTSN